MAALRHLRAPRPTNPLLRARDGRLFLLAQALDALAAGVSGVALPWLVLAGGGASWEAGVVYTFSVLPYVVFGLPAGVVGDRAQPRAVLLSCYATQAVFAAAVPAWSLSGHPPLVLVLLAAAAIGTARVFADASAFGAIASLMGRDDYVQGQAMLSAAWSLGFLVGPAIGGALIAVIGPSRTLVAESAAFLLAAVAVLAMRSALAVSEPAWDERVRDALRGGVRFIFGDRFIRALTAANLAYNAAAAGVLALIVPLSRQAVGLSSGQTGVVLAVEAGMGIAAVPVVGLLERRLGAPRLLAAAQVVAAAGTAALAVAPGFLVLTAAFAVEGLAAWVAVSIFIGERQRRAPERLQSRAGISGRMLAMASMTAGSAAASALTGVISLRELYGLMAAGTALAFLTTTTRLLRVADPAVAPRPAA